MLLGKVFCSPSPRIQETVALCLVGRAGPRQAS